MTVLRPTALRNRPAPLHSDSRENHDHHGSHLPGPRRAFPAGRWDDARALLLEMAVSDEYSDFLTLPAYERMP